MHKAYPINNFLVWRYLALLLLPLHLQAQRIDDYVREKTAAIATIDPDSTNFADLEVIGKAIGSASVVFLGEQDHGDAPTFLAKARLIKYLHERKGFNVLAFESDFFGLNAGWDRLEKDPDSIGSFLRGNIYGAWTACPTCRQLLFQYIPGTYRTDRPLTVSGFDNNMLLLYSYRTLYRQLDSVLRHYDLPMTQEAAYSGSILPLLTSTYSASAQGDQSYDRRDSCLRKIREQLAARLSPDDFWLMVTDNLIQSNLEFKNKANYWQKVNIRDQQMAKNLKWLCQTKFAGKKIIVWAANYHISKYNGHYPEDFLNEATTMGGIFTSDSVWLQRSYVIGFTSYGGEAGRIYQKIYEVPKPNANSYENWVDKTLSFGFTDFSGWNAAHAGVKEAFFMSGSVKGNAMHTHHKAVWNRVFDGVFFIRKMYACVAGQ